MIAAAEFETKTVDWSEGEYHSDKLYLSRGKLADAAESFRIFEGKHVTFTAPPEDRKDYWDIGTAVHLRVLEPHKFHNQVLTYPAGILGKNGAVNTDAAKRFRDEHRAEGRIVLKADDMAEVKLMAESLKRTVGNFVEQAVSVEQTILWQDDESGLLCRCRPDFYLDNGSMIMAFDLKTSESIEEHEFRGKIESLRYFLQDAHYSAGIRKLTNKPVLFFFVPAEKAWPWRSRIFNLKPQSVAEAADRRVQLLSELAHRLDENDFSEPWEGQITSLEVRPFAFG